MHKKAGLYIVLQNHTLMQRQTLMQNHTLMQRQTLMQNHTLMQRQTLMQKVGLRVWLCETSSIHIHRYEQFNKKQKLSLRSKYHAKSPTMKVQYQI